MQCMKCGREIANRQVFCEECLTEMEKYPVKPGTVVQLPPRPKQAPARKNGGHHKAARSQEEQIKRLKRRNWILGGLLAVTLAMLIVLALFTKDYIEENKDKLLPGQNYSVAEDPAKTTDGP